MNGAIGGASATGLNNHGQLGDGTTTSRKWFERVDPFGTWRTTQIAAGSQHALFLYIDGTVRSCGLNDRGQLGDGTTSDRAFAMEVQWPSVFVGDRPTETRPLDAIIALAAGSRHSIALRADRKVLAWGANDKGQLGDGTLGIGKRNLQRKGADRSRRPFMLLKNGAPLIHASVVSPWLPSLIRYRGTGRNVHQRRRYREECNEPCENPHCQGYARLYWDSAYRDHGNFPQKAHSVRQQRPKRLSVPAAMERGRCAGERPD